MNAMELRSDPGGATFVDGSERRGALPPMAERMWNLDYSLPLAELLGRISTGDLEQIFLAENRESMLAALVLGLKCWCRKKGETALPAEQVDYVTERARSICGIEFGRRGIRLRLIRPYPESMFDTHGPLAMGIRTTGKVQ